VLQCVGVARFRKKNLRKVKGRQCDAVVAESDELIEVNVGAGTKRDFHNRIVEPNQYQTHRDQNFTKRRLGASAQTTEVVAIVGHC